LLRRRSGFSGGVDVEATDRTLGIAAMSLRKLFVSSAVAAGLAAVVASPASAAGSVNVTY
jgi:hypothetical protein